MNTTNTFERLINKLKLAEHNLYWADSDTYITINGERMTERAYYEREIERLWDEMYAYNENLADEYLDSDDHWLNEQETLTEHYASIGAFEE